MSAGFTPGPWSLVSANEWPGHHMIVGPSFKVTFWTAATDITAAAARQRLKDARLIAAAPELYEALEAVWQNIHIDDPKVGRLVAAARRKARGEVGSMTDLIAREWQRITSAPLDGTRVRLAHELDPQSMKVESIFTTHGVFRDGAWVCNNAFVCLDNMLRWQPTHWMPLEKPESDQ